MPGFVSRAAQSEAEDLKQRGAGGSGRRDNAKMSSQVDGFDDDDVIARTQLCAELS